MGFSAKWSWFDDNDWVEYNAATNEAIEKGFLEGKRKVPVDTERYVEFSAKRTITNTFGSAFLQNNTSCIAIQRRFDDKNKRRAVQRVFTPLFEGDVVFISPVVEKEKQNLLVAMIKQYGGEAHKGRSSKKGDTICVQTSTSTVSQNSIPTVTEKWIEDSVQNGKRETLSNYLVGSKTQTNKTNDTESDKKRKRTESDDEKEKEDSDNESVQSKKAKRSDSIASCEQVSSDANTQKQKSNSESDKNVSEKTDVDVNSIDFTKNESILNRLQKVVFSVSSQETVQTNSDIIGKIRLNENGTFEGTLFGCKVIEKK